MGANTMRRGVLIVALGLLLFGGCIQAKIIRFMAYDAASDSFTFVHVYANLASQEESELDHIEALWQRRENLILNALPELALFSSPTIFLRLDTHAYSKLPLAHQPREQAKRLTTTVDLDAIEVHPGEFFLNEHGNACYYHQINVPGEVVDGVLEEIAPVLATALGEYAQARLEQAATEDAQAVTWMKFREALLASLQAELGGAQGGEQAPPPPAEIPLDADSLRLLKEAGQKRQLLVEREGGAIAIVLPLSARDSREAVATFEMVQQLASDLQAKGKPVDTLLANALNSIELGHVDEQAVRVAVDLAAWSRQHLGQVGNMPKESETNRAACLATIAALRGRGIAISEEDLYPAIVAQVRERVRAAQASSSSKLLLAVLLLFVVAAACVSVAVVVKNSRRQPPSPLPPPRPPLPSAG